MMKKNNETIDFNALANETRGSKGSKAVTFILLLICIVLTAAVIYKMFSAADAVTVQAAKDDTFSTTVNVSAAEASYGVFSKTSRLNGEISREGNDITVLPDITSSGTVTEILVKEGDSIAVGDTIAYIDPSRPGQSSLPSPVISKASGIVSDLMVSVGETVSASTPIVTLTNNDDLIITAAVPEKFLGSLRPGMSAEFESVAYPGRIYTGTLTYISPTLDRATRSADIKIEITGLKAGLMDGMYVKLSLETEHIDNAMMIPSSALSTYLGEDVVYKIVDGVAKRQPVTIGSQNDESTVVFAGLEEGDLVVTAGNVTNDTPVNIV